MSFPRPLPHMMKPKTVLADMVVEDTTSSPLWEILVPTVSNTGRPFSVRHHRRWDSHVKAIAGVMTLVQPVRGSWIEPETGQEFAERMIPVGHRLNEEPPMTTIDCSPQTIPADRLDRAIELDTEFIVNDDGTVELTGGFAPDVTGHQGPGDPTIENHPERWDFFSRDYSGQHSYSGPEMHQSEHLGGRLAEDVLAAPGTYAVVGVRYACDPDSCGDLFDTDELCCPEASHLESWAVLRSVDPIEPTAAMDES